MNRIEKALDLFNKGFHTKADQKRCLELVSRHYEEVRHKITDGFLNMRNAGTMTDEEMSPLYYDFPYGLHQIRPKHSVIYSIYFPEEMTEIEYLVQLRNTVKEAPIVKIVSETVEQKEKVEKIEKSLKEIFEHNMNECNRGLRLAELFKYLPISVTPHWVFRDGGRFIRYFYFMAGKLTALNTILCIMQTLEDEKETI